MPATNPIRNDKLASQRPCKNCARLFRPILDNVRKGFGFFCSRACARTNRRNYARRPTATPEERFWKKVKKGRGCWLWTGCRNPRGYGRFGLSGKRHGKIESAHRVSWFFAHGIWPGKRMVRHRCDNPPCVRPSHLVRGAHFQNVSDAVRRKRIATGKRLPQTKLTPAIVRKIRMLHAGGMSQSALGRRFGVHGVTVFDIIHRISWKHVA